MRFPIDQAILSILAKNGDEFEGIKALANEILSQPYYVRHRLERLAQDGLLTVIHLPPGRGRKARIRKVNRNSPGYPRQR